MDSIWNSLELVKVIISVLTPLTVIFLGYWINLRLKSVEKNQQDVREERRQQLEEKREAEHVEREEKKNEIERRYQPHIEFKIDCQFFGPLLEDKYLTNFCLIADNRGHVLHRFPSIKLRVRGIKKGESLQYWEGQEPRFKFPHKVFETEVVPSGWNFIFVEPGVAQSINFTSIVSADYSFIVVKAEFHYDKYTPHSVENIFEVPMPKI